MNMRKDVYERMRYFVLEKIKPNYAAIARQYDVDPRTVKAAYLRAQSDKTAVVRKRRSRRIKLDGYPLKTNTPQVVLPDRFMTLSLKKALLASTQSLKIIVVVFVKHKQKKQRLKLSIQLD